MVTNTTPVGAYRGAGRPEAAAAIDRAMDLFAAAAGVDPAEVRRKNLLPKFTEPHKTAFGAVYDSGDYVTALERALAAADYPALLAEQAKRRPAATRCSSASACPPTWRSPGRAARPAGRTRTAPSRSTRTAPPRC